MSKQEQTLEQWAGASKMQLALLFTDIIGSTALVAKYGDDEWVEMLIHHFKRARQLRDACDCYEVKLIGDAYMVVFRTADIALRFASYLILDPGHPEIEIRAAIHVGSVRIIENDIYGLMVNYVSRLISTAGDIPTIVVSDHAYASIISSIGNTGRQLFRPYDADLKSFGKEPAWKYINASVDGQLALPQRKKIKQSDFLNPSPVSRELFTTPFFIYPKPEDDRK
jgi:class 3 adenylate cyclase